MNQRTYQAYLAKLKAYAALSGVRLKFSGSDLIQRVGGKYNRTQRLIIIPKNLKPAEVISTILHELGHFIDNYRNPERMLNTHYLYAERKLGLYADNKLNNSFALPESQKNIIWEAELEAWKNGEALANQLKIPLGQWFHKDKIASLNTYRTIKKG